MNNISNMSYERNKKTAASSVTLNLRLFEVVLLLMLIKKLSHDIKTASNFVQSCVKSLFTGIVMIQPAIAVSPSSGL